jgi:hypothetical protein
MIRPLKSKTAEEVALQLVDIFSILGAPVLLHTDNGREFTASKVKFINFNYNNFKN